MCSTTFRRSLPVINILGPCKISAENGGGPALVIENAELDLLLELANRIKQKFFSRSRKLVTPRTIQV